MDTKVKLYRRRHIPQEFFILNKDRVLYLDDQYLITRWETLHSRQDFSSGISIHDFKNNWKITRMARPDGSLFQWYCDIVKFEINRETSTYTIEDLLADVIIDADGTVNVVDLDEAADAFEQGLISAEDLTLSLRSTNHLLQLIRGRIPGHSFEDYRRMIEQYL